MGFRGGLNGTLDLTSAQTTVSGGGETIDIAGGSGNIASLYSTGGVADTVNGSSATLDLNSVQVAVNGNSDTLNFSGNNTVTAAGTSEAFVFQPAIGVNTIGGFGSTDSMTFSSTDFASWSALLSHASQVGSNTVIALDAADKVTLTGVAIGSLQQSQFHFA